MPDGICKYFSLRSARRESAIVILRSFSIEQNAGRMFVFLDIEERLQIVLLEPFLHFLSHYQIGLHIFRLV